MPSLPVHVAPCLGTACRVFAACSISFGIDEDVKVVLPSSHRVEYCTSSLLPVHQHNGRKTSALASLGNYQPMDQPPPSLSSYRLPASNVLSALAFILSQSNPIQPSPLSFSSLLPSPSSHLSNAPHLAPLLTKDRASSTIEFFFFYFNPSCFSATVYSPHTTPFGKNFPVENAYFRNLHRLLRWFDLRLRLPY